VRASLATLHPGLAGGPAAAHAGGRAPHRGPEPGRGALQGQPVLCERAGAQAKHAAGGGKGVLEAWRAEGFVGGGGLGCAL